MTTEEGNKAIAVFMGAEMIAPLGHTMRGVKFPKETHGLWVHAADDLLYHTSWDWLMPVVEKIASLGYIVEIVTTPKYKSCRIYRSDEKIANCGVIVDEIPFKAITQFITWYNQNSKQ